MPSDALATADVLRFGPFELRPQTRQLLQRSAEVAIGGRAFDLLCALAQRRHRVVPSSELLQIVWPGQPVEPNNLQVQIWTLRKLLGPRVITTVARRGYRFMPALAGPLEDRPIPSNPWDEKRLQALLDRAEDHRLVTLVGHDGESLLQLALACAHRLAQPVGGVVWRLDASAAAQTARGTEASILDHLPRRDVDRPDVMVLHHPDPSLSGVGPVLQAALRHSARIRLLVVSPAALGLPQEQVLSIVAPRQHQLAPGDGSALRWQARGRHR